MKKILPTMILLLFCCNLGYAEEIIQTSNVAPITSAETTGSVSSPATVTPPIANPIINVNSNPGTFINDSDEEVIELRGYVQYEDEPQETIFLEEQGETPQNTIYMKTPTYKNSLDLKAPERVGSKSLITAINKKQIQNSNVNRLEAASKFSTQEYNINPVSRSYSGKSGNMTFGTTYDSSISSAQLNYSTGVFTRYDGKHFAITSAISKNTGNNYDSYNDKMYIAPELKLTKRFSILNVIQSDMTQINKKNEVVLRYRPKIGSHSDDIQFELGAAQSFRENQYINSSVRFSTRFKL